MMTANRNIPTIQTLQASTNQQDSSEPQKRKKKYHLSLDSGYYEIKPDPEDQPGENSIAQLKELRKLCEEMKEAKPTWVEIYADGFLEEIENKIVIEAFDELIQSGCLKKIKFILFGYDHDEPEDLLLLAELFENLVLKHYSEETGHKLEHINFGLADIPLYEMSFINSFQDESLRNFEECIKRLPPSVCIRGLNYENRHFIFSLLKHRKKIKLSDHQFIFDDAKEEGEDFRAKLETVLLNNMTLTEIELEDQSFDQLINLVSSRNQFVSKYPQYFRLLNYDYSKNPEAIDFVQHAYSLLPVNTKALLPVCMIDSQTKISDLEALSKLGHNRGMICILSEIPIDLLKRIPEQSKILASWKMKKNAISFLKEKKCEVIKYKKDNHPSVSMLTKEVPYLELKNYCEEINKKIIKKGGVIKNILESYQGIHLILNKETEQQEEELGLINELKALPKVSYLVGLSRSIKIDPTIERKDFEKVKEILGAYEFNRIEIASSEEKEQYLKSIQNQFQNKGYAIKVEWMNEWQIELMSETMQNEETRALFSDMQMIDGIKCNGNYLTFSNKLSLSNFKLFQEKLNRYECLLKKKVVPANHQSAQTSKIKTEDLRPKESPDYFFRQEKTKPKNHKPTQQPKKNKTAKGKGAAKQAKASVAQKKSHVVHHLSNPTYTMPVASSLSLEEKTLRENLKQKDRVNKGSLLTPFASTLAVVPISTTASTSTIVSSSSTSVSTSNELSLFSAPSKASEKKIHCIYNGGQQVESFIYPPLFTKAMTQIKYVLNLNEEILSRENGKLSEASFYGLIQLLEMTQKLFELQKVEQKRQTFAGRVLDIGLIMDLRQNLKPENMMRYKNNEKAYKKFQETFISFREQLIHNFNSMIFGYENEFDKNEMMQLDSMRNYKDRFKIVFDRFNAPLGQFNQFASKESRTPQNMLAALLEQYASTCGELVSSQDQKDKVIFVSTIKYLMVAIADLSEKLFYPDKNQFIGLIAIRNRLMHVMESEGSGVIRDLVKDDECLKSQEVQSSIDFLKSKIQIKQGIAQSM